VDGLSARMEKSRVDSGRELSRKTFLCVRRAVYLVAGVVRRRRALLRPRRSGGAGKLWCAAKSLSARATSLGAGMSSSCAVERTQSAHCRVPAVLMKCCDADIQLSFAKRIPGWDGSGRDGREPVEDMMCGREWKRVPN
jgi:hypothetical protein